MIYQNAELYNAAELIRYEDGSVSWIRVPAAVREAMETDQGKQMAGCATGVELSCTYGNGRTASKYHVQGNL